MEWTKEGQEESASWLEKAVLKVFYDKTIQRNRSFKRSAQVGRKERCLQNTIRGRQRRNYGIRRDKAIQSRLRSGSPRVMPTASKPFYLSPRGGSAVRHRMRESLDFSCCWACAAPSGTAALFASSLSGRALAFRDVGGGVLSSSSWWDAATMVFQAEVVLLSWPAVPFCACLGDKAVRKRTLSFRQFCLLLLLALLVRSCPRHVGCFRHPSRAAGWRDSFHLQRRALEFPRSAWTGRSA